jgi:hypothetical protein
VAEELAFQSFNSVFRTGLDDPVLLNAIMLSLTFAIAGGSVSQECLGYQSHAISGLRQKIGSLNEATSESTIGAILLLAGVEVCPHLQAQHVEPAGLTAGSLGLSWYDTKSSASHGRSAAATGGLSNRGYPSHQRNKEGDILVRNDARICDLHLHQ